MKSWLPGIYEPESTAFGGALAMDAAHDLFHEDSRHLLTYHRGPGQLGRRETAVLLLSAMMRAANLNWFEQGDVWAKAAALRPATDFTSERAVALIPAMRTLMTVDARSLCRPDRPLDGHAEWVATFERAGTTLAYLATGGGLARGLRAVIAHHMIFHANRAGLLPEDQSALFTTAREAVMGSSDNTASSTGATPDTTSVKAVTTDTITPNGAEAARLRNALVDQIRASGYTRTPEVETALRSVPRHLFVPGAPLEDAYANSPVNIKYDTDGTSISCASQPGVVALMLDQLDALPGERILELGAGTSYNAALLAHLVGEKGHVTTVDVDDDLVEGARAHLATAGFSNVAVLTRDGAVGNAEGAPYDRIIATVGAHGVPADLTHTDGDRREVHAWLWRVLLADGTRTLTTTGRWQEALAHIKQHHGIGTRMLDGRQVAIVAALTEGNTEHAAKLLTNTTAGEPWEQIVTGCLTVFCRRDADQAVDSQVAHLVNVYLGHEAKPGLTSFDIRLGLTALDAVGSADHPETRGLIEDMARRTAEARDGYAARELLAHPLAAALSTAGEARHCSALVRTCALGAGTRPDDADLSATLNTAQAVLTRTVTIIRGGM